MTLNRDEGPQSEEARIRRNLLEFARRIRQPDIRPQLDAAALNVLTALASAGVDGVLLKGPVLERVLYGPSEPRYYDDVDLLVEPNAFARARDIVRRRGYMSIEEGLGVIDVGGGLHGETWVAGEVMIDLHWRLPGVNVAPQVAWKALTEERLRITLQGQPVPALAPPALAVHVVLHAAQHGPRHARGLRDLELALERWPVQIWTQAEALVRRLDATPSFAAGLRLNARGAALTRKLGLPAGLEIGHASPPSRPPRGSFHLKAFRDVGSFRLRASLLRRAAFPPRRWIEWQYPWAWRGGPSVALAYIRHLAHAPIWAARAWWRSRGRAGLS